MGKLKTKKGVAKRFKLTAKRKIKHATCGKGHLLTSKRPSRLRKMRKAKIIGGEAKYLKRMLPYG